MNSSKIDEILRFYLLATQLKDVVRSGRITRNIQRKRVESVAEHIYGTCILAIAIHSEFSAELEHEIDLYKVIVMLVIHELEEIVIGDLTPYDTMSPEERLRQGREAVQMVLGNLTKKAEYLALTNEFNKQTTPEARFAKMCDKLEADLQVRKYEEEGAISIERDVNNARGHELIQQFIQQGESTIAGVRAEFDRPTFAASEVFTEILETIKKDWNDERNHL